VGAVLHLQFVRRAPTNNWSGHLTTPDGSSILRGVGWAAKNSVPGTASCFAVLAIFCCPLLFFIVFNLGNIEWRRYPVLPYVRAFGFVMDAYKPSIANNKDNHLQRVSLTK
jgi:hypothetical protein